MLDLVLYLAPSYVVTYSDGAEVLTGFCGNVASACCRCVASLPSQLGALRESRESVAAKHDAEAPSVTIVDVRVDVLHGRTTRPWGEGRVVLPRVLDDFTQLGEGHGFGHYLPFGAKFENRPSRKLLVSSGSLKMRSPVALPISRAISAPCFSAVTGTTSTGTGLVVCSCFL